MVAVPEGRFHLPEATRDPGSVPVPVHDRRFVAVSVGAVELLRPESDLLRLVEGAGYVDVLIAADDPPVGPPAPLGVLAGCAVDGPACDGDDDGYDDRDAEPGDEVFAALGLPDLHVHRLGLHPPVGPQHEDDLVAALSELVGFDPEPGVFLLGPAVAPADPARSVVDQAAQRIARVYGIPLLRFRCHELCVVTAPGT